jgi:hypothetical protein
MEGGGIMDFLPLIIVISLPFVMIGLRMLIVWITARNDASNFNEIYVLRDGNGKKITVVIEKYASEEDRAEIISEKARQLNRQKAG